MLTTLDRVKALHGSITGTSADAALTAIIVAVDSMVNRYLGVDLSSGNKVDTFEVSGERRFLLRTFPVATVTEIASALDGDYTSPYVLNARDYYIDTRRGSLIVRPSGTLYDDPSGLRVTYTGGLPDGWQADALYTYYLGLDYAAAIQVLAEYTRRPDWGAVTKSAGGSSRTHTVEDDPRASPLLPKVMNILDQYRR